jgi:hypothetical protein
MFGSAAIRKELKMSTSLTSHARLRAVERTSLSSAEVCHLLDKNFCVPIGREEGKIHKLFYSLPDKAYFVAVLDEQTAELITILLHNHNIRWHISNEAMKTARNFFEPERAAEVPEEIPYLSGAKNLHFTVVIQSANGGPRSVEIGKVKKGAWGNTVNLFPNSVVLQVLSDRLAALELEAGEKVEQVLVRAGKHAPSVPLVLPSSFYR